MHRIILMVLLAVACESASAEIYRHVDKEGRITYSATPMKGAKTQNPDPTLITNGRWTEISGDSDGTFTTYADLATMRRTGNKVKMWDLIDYMPVQVDASGKQYKSKMAQHEYDCKEKQGSLLYLAHYSGNMGGGEAVYFDSIPSDERKWWPVTPSSMGEFMLRFACKKR